jgi:hypothetical protein
MIPPEDISITSTIAGLRLFSGALFLLYNLFNESAGPCFIRSSTLFCYWATEGISLIEKLDIPPNPAVHLLQNQTKSIFMKRVALITETLVSTLLLLFTTGLPE